jgi:hypothetical protein
MARRKLIVAMLCGALCVLGLAGGIGITAGDLKFAKPVTFSKDVAPIFYNNCVACHRPNDLAPMSLITYKEARPWARSIREKVVSREMPPWHADPHYGEFSNDRRLSQKDIATVVAWVDQGAKEGDPKDLTSAPAFVEGWHIGKPDVVLSMQEEHAVEAEGPDDYLYFTIPTGFKEDRWVQAAEIQPGNRKVVHHVIAFLGSPDAAANAAARRRSQALSQGFFTTEGTLRRVKMDAPVNDDGCNSPANSGANRRSGNDANGTFLAGYAPGKDWDVFPTGVAKKIPAGSVIIFQVHYNKSTGKPEKDRSSIGLIFATHPPEQMAMTTGISNLLFKIPPGADDHEVTSCQTLDRDVVLFSYMPHMHLRGKDMRYEAIYPDGRRETLLWVPHYSFSWQMVYKLKKPILLPKGTKLVVTAHFDNSTRNKYNPDANKFVRWGDPTYDEMMIGWIDYLVDVGNKGEVAAKAGQ